MFNGEEGGGKGEGEEGEGEEGEGEEGEGEEGEGVTRRKLLIFICLKEELKCNVFFYSKKINLNYINEKSKSNLNKNQNKIKIKTIKKYFF